MKRNRIDAEAVLQKVAMKNHTTVEEVRKEIKLAMLAGMCNPDPAVQAKWKGIPHEGEVPTPEEMIAHLAGKLIK